MKVFLEFSIAGDAVRAVKTLKAVGYLDIETHAPFPMTDEDAHAARGSFPLAFLAFVAGMMGLIGAYLVQWYANVGSYPVDAGGRPVHAAAAFIPATFESVCLFAAAAVVAGFLLFEHLPRLWQPVFEIEGFERATVDRFWVVVTVDGDTSAGERVSRDVAPLQALRVVVSEDA